MKTFPGMNPYLEYHRYWRGFHNALALTIAEQLNAQIYPAYIAQTEMYTIFESVQVSGRSGAYPDVAAFDEEATADFVKPQAAVITKPSLRVATLVEADTARREILILSTESRELVTAIEILSPANKSGDGFAQYLEKRNKILHSEVHLVEIDLLRKGHRVSEEVGKSIDTDYIVVVNRASNTRFSDIWTIPLNQSLPTIPIPLLFPDPEVTINLMAVMAMINQRHHYDAIPDYSRPPPPPKLRSPIKAWWREAFGEVM